MSVFVVVTTFYTLECVLSFFFLRCCTSDDNISPPLGGEVARRSRDGEVVSDLQQPFSQPSAASSPARGALLPRKKVTSIRITTASSIDGSRSKATSYKFDTPVSGGAYQDAREVTLVWNGT